MENPDFEYFAWDKLQLFKSIPKETLAVMDSGKSPHHLLDGKLIPDGNGPCRIYHKASDTHINVLEETDRNTEPLTTKERRRNIEQKMDNYKSFFDAKGYKAHYGFSGCFVRWVTTDEANRLAMMRLWESKFGPSKYMLFATRPDWFYQRSYPPADGEMFTRGYDRVGYSPYHFNKFPIMDR